MMRLCWGLGLGIAWSLAGVLIPRDLIDDIFIASFKDIMTFAPSLLLLDLLLPTIAFLRTANTWYIIKRIVKWPSVLRATHCPYSCRLPLIISCGFQFGYYFTPV